MTVASILAVAACGIDAVGIRPGDVDAVDASVDGQTDATSLPDSDADGGGVTPTSDGGTPRVSGALALYTFREGTGQTVRDVSGVTPALDLTIQVPNGARWFDGGLALDSDSLLFSAAATRIVTACKFSNEVTLEAWVKPANATQGAGSPARIAGLTIDTGTLDVSLSAYGDRYLFRVRTSASNEANNDLFSDGGVSTALTHVVTTRHANGVRRGYVNGVLVAETTTPGDFSTWSDYAIAVANEHTATRPWLGELRLIAIYGRALAVGEILQNRAAGP